MNNQSYIELEKVKKKIDESLARYGEYSNEFHFTKKYILFLKKIRLYLTI